MSYLVLARKYRPQAFDDVTGQEHVVQTLGNAIAQDRVAHAFLLCGPRGVGKTTTARLLARALNCASGPTATPCGTCQPCREIVAGSSVDVVEIDGASNNGVDNVRELREAARYLPQRDRHKIFIIDEVHMLSVAAFNALLKTLEEPPPHVKFVFATTDPQKLPDTILSRCQRHNFRRVPAGKMVERLRHICGEEGIAISDRALGLVARQADGGMRDALSLLDQLLSSAGTSIDDAAVEEALGLVDRTVVHTLAGALLDRDGKRLVEALAGVYDRGVDAKRLCEELAQHLRDLVYVKAVGEAPGDRGDVEQKLLVEQAGKADAPQLTRLFDLVHHAIRELSYAAQPRLALEVALLSAVHLAPSQGLADLAARLDAVAATLSSGAPARAPAAAPSPSPARAAPAPGRPMPAAPAPAPSQAQRPVAMPTSDLVKQVEALTRGRPAPRQAGGRPPGRGTPPAGGDEEPHGAAHDAPSAARPQPSQGARTTGGPPPGFSPLGRPAPAAPPPGFSPLGRPAPAAPPPGFSPLGRPAPAAPPPGFSPLGRPAPAAPPPATPPGAGSAPATPFVPPEGFPAPRGFGGGDAARPAAPAPRGDDRPQQQQRPDFRAAIAARAAMPAPAPAWDDDEPPPPGDDDAPPFGDDDGFSSPDVRRVQVDTSPGGCATNECTVPEPAAPPAPAPGAGPGDDPTAEVHARWRDAVEAVRRKNALIGSCLAEGRLVWLRGGEVALGYAPAKAFHRAQLESSMRLDAERHLADWFGAPMRLNLQQAAADAPASLADEERKAREERRVRLRAEAREHPAVLAVQSILGGEIDDIEVLEER